MEALHVIGVCILFTLGGVGSHLKRLQPNLNYVYPKERYFVQKLDHFNPTIDTTFKQRYMISDQYWDQNGGPILFYAGNEGDITLFVNNTGLLWDIAPEFHAMVVFAEHRYYGKSKPYPDLKPNPENVEKFGQFTVEQALADFAELILKLKSKMKGARNSPVVVFGGSYGGMLAAWLRQKYPHIVIGALAASAPVRYFPSLVKCDSYYEVVTNDFLKTPNGEACVDNIRRSWSVIEKVSKFKDGMQMLTDIFRLCEPLKHVSELINWLQEAWGSLAMVDYPYPSNFLNPLPAWPIKETCQCLSEKDLIDADLLKAIHNAAGVFYNYTGKFSCFSLNAEASTGLSTKLWDFQTCTEMVMPFCANGIVDMFKPSNWTFDSFNKTCNKKYATTPRPLWPVIQFGAYDLKAASNIIFSNGDLDPWSVGGILHTSSQNITVLRILHAAHHLDLRHANSLDPKSVVMARRQEIEQIAIWIREAGYKVWP